MQLSSLADTVERTTAASVNESHPTYSGAIAYFHGIIEDYPRSEYSARSYYQIGLLLFERYFDLDGALTSFQNVERELPGVPVLHYDVSLKIGEILVAKGDTTLASTRFVPVTQAADATPDQADEAGFRLAEISYFGGNFKVAIDRLSEISFNLKANYANDALSLLSFLQENTATSEPALAKFARADFLTRQRRNSEAIPIFLQVITEYPQALLVDDALMKVADLQARSGMYVESIASYERLLREFKETSIALDRAQFHIAEIYDRSLHDNTAALAAYSRVLADYPESLLGPLVRKRIRALRGESL
jgi:TolA-binding protein